MFLFILGPMPLFPYDLLLDFFELIGTDAAQGALVILGQFVTLVDVVTNGADKLFHAVAPPCFS